MVDLSTVGIGSLNSFTFISSRLTSVFACSLSATIPIPKFYISSEIYDYVPVINKSELLLSGLSILKVGPKIAMYCSGGSSKLLSSALSLEISCC